MPADTLFVLFVVLLIAVIVSIGVVKSHRKAKADALTSRERETHRKAVEEHDVHQRYRSREGDNPTRIVDRGEGTGDPIRDDSARIGTLEDRCEQIQSIDAQEAPCNTQSDVVHLVEAIKKTWGVDCRILSLTQDQAKTLSLQTPLDNRFREDNDQYHIRLSPNSILIHPFGAWVDLGYLMFFYHDSLYYVNVDPTVRLVTTIYKRMDDLSHMAKIMIVLNEHLGAERKTLLIRLRGELDEQPRRQTGQS